MNAIEQSMLGCDAGFHYQHFRTVTDCQETGCRIRLLDLLTSKQGVFRGTIVNEKKLLKLLNKFHKPCY